MIQNLFSLVAETVIRDHDSNSMSAINVIEEAIADGFPLFFPKLTFFTMWEKEVDDPAVYDGTLVVTLGETLIGQHNVTVNFQQGTRARLNANFQGLVLREYGRMTFTATVGGVVARYHLDIKPRAVAADAPVHVAPAPLPGPEPAP